MLNWSKPPTHEPSARHSCWKGRGKVV